MTTWPANSNCRNALAAGIVCVLALALGGCSRIYNRLINATDHEVLVTGRKYAFWLSPRRSYCRRFPPAMSKADIILEYGGVETIVVHSADGRHVGDIAIEQLKLHSNYAGLTVVVFDEGVFVVYPFSKDPPWDLESVRQCKEDIIDANRKLFRRFYTSGAEQRQEASIGQ